MKRGIKVFVLIAFVLLSIQSVSAKHVWWHFWGEEPQLAYYYQCGNGVVDAGEVCDGGPVAGSSGARGCIVNGYNGYQTCRSDCQGYNNCIATEKCGDKIIQSAAGEECDDGNAINGDGCSATCKKEATQTCTDSDGGNKPDIFGIVNATNQTGKFTFNDVCISTSSLSENFCNADNTRGKQLVNCPNGCENGKCKPESGLPDSCIDSDKGEDPNQFGMVNITNKTGIFTFNDYCSGSGGSIVEYFCNADGKTKNSKLFTCEAGCLNGACKPVSNVTNQTCTDTDGGINVDKFGIVNITNKTGIFSISDICKNSTYLSEVSCSGDNRLIYSSYLCPNGCLNGACKPVSNVTNQTSICVDSDGGDRPYTKGQVNITNKTGIFTFNDYCSGNSVFEYWCNTADGSFVSYSAECVNGCSDGECKPSAESCSDSDGGLNIEIAGFANTSNGTIIIDRCIDNDVLLEAECDPLKDGAIDDETISCGGYGRVCFEGVCKPAPIAKGKIFKVISIFNSTIGLSNDKVELTDVRTGDIYSAIITADGIGTFTIGGKVYTVKYFDNRNVGDDEYIEMESPPSYPPEETIRHQKVFRNSYLIMGNPEWNGIIAKVSQISNQTTGFSSDKVTFTDFKTGDIYQVTITKEGEGTISIQGKSYTVRYFGSAFTPTENRYIEIDFEQRVFYNAYVVFPENIAPQQPNVCGNGIIERENVEACDDGNLINGDGCSDKCRFESNPLNSNCTDSDNGFNTKIAGFTSADGVRIDDVCVGDSVYEAGCDPNNNGTIDGDLIFCLNGCVNGTCIGNNCRLASASWSVTESAVGQVVKLAVTGSDCQEQEVSFEVREKDVISADDPVSVNPKNAKFIKGVANSQWTVEAQFDEGFTKPEYYFIARLVEDPEKDIQSGLLQVI